MQIFLTPTKDYCLGKKWKENLEFGGVGGGDVWRVETGGGKKGN